VSPLLTTPSGAKFGKTETGTVWLDQARTSPFRFYQFWLNADDADVVTYLKYFTFVGQGEIEELAGLVSGSPEKREAQRALAREVTAMVHGVEQVSRVEHASALLFGEDVASLPVEDVLGGIRIVDLVARVKLAPSKSEARRLVESGGVYVNNRRATDPQTRLGREDAIGGRLFILRKGQKQNHLVRLT
jgi:tyrosyl-tRNA synthetase